MTSAEEKISFEQLPQLMVELKSEITGLRDQFDNFIQANHGRSADSWMNIDELREYHPNHPAKPTIYDWVCLRKIPFHKSGKQLRFLKSEIDEWLHSGRIKTDEEITKQATTYINDRRIGK